VSIPGQKQARKKAGRATTPHRKKLETQCTNDLRAYTYEMLVRHWMSTQLHAVTTTESLA
jgi:hypothetical protein